MKRSLPYLEGAVLSLLAAWSAVGCLITAFQLPVVLDTRAGLFWCAVCAAGMALFSLRKGGRLVLLLTALGIAAAWHFLALKPQLLGVLGWIASAFHRAYNWGIPEMLQDAPAAGIAPLVILGIFLIESVSYCVIRKRGSWLATALLVLSLSACLVVTNTVPNDLCLFVLLACLALLLLSQSVRAEGSGTRLTIAAALPVVLALGLLFYLVPQDTYENNTAPLRQQIMDYAQALADRVQSGDLGLPNYDRRRDRVDLTTLPSQPQLGLPVAEIAAELTGPVYLRVQDYDVYTGTSWLSSQGRQETLSGTGEAIGAVVIRELSGQAGMLLPSYPTGNTLLENGLSVNDQGEKVYRFQCVRSAMSATPAESNLKLPEGTGTAGRALVQRIAGESTGVEATAQAIAAYVRSCAPYDRIVQPMPQGSGDFALWFLESGKPGYCVHFATAAVILLRSAGIPARYVTGYRAEAVAGQTVRVTTDQAHAWAEYYNYKTWSWSVLEATPAEQELTPEETAPATQPQTLPTATTPTQSTAQPEATMPAPQAEPQKAFPIWIPLAILAAAATVCCVQLQRMLRIRLRQRRQRRGPSNRRAIARWEEATLLHRLLATPVPEELEALAQKAMFSQHTLTREELNLFAEDARACRAELNQRPWFRRLCCRYWYAVI